MLLRPELVFAVAEIVTSGSSFSRLVNTCIHPLAVKH
jgi:hypothetical protein